VDKINWLFGGEVIDLGGSIKKVRALRNISQKELAKDINCDLSFISRLESNSRKPSLKVIEKISKDLQVPMWVLFALAEKDYKELPDILRQKILDYLL
jgi:transcriptional regulator with XRE-family HTH domain